MNITHNPAAGTFDVAFNGGINREDLRSASVNAERCTRAEATLLLTTLGECTTWEAALLLDGAVG